MEDFDTHTSEYLMWWAKNLAEAVREYSNYVYERCDELQHEWATRTTKQLRWVEQLHNEVFMRKVIAEGMSLEAFKGKQQ